MPITSSKCGVWSQSDIAKKINASRWTTYDTGGDPTCLLVFGSSTSSGESGLNQGALNVSSPVQIEGASWCKIDFGFVSAGIRTDNTLWIWGNNAYGQLGLNDRAHRSSPTQVPGTDWCDVVVGKETSQTTVFAIKAGNTLWSWGSNVDGEMGINDMTNLAYSSPVQIPGSSWCKVVAGIDAHFAIRTDNTLWGWGSGLLYGGIGLNNSDLVSSPTQLPGSWCKIATTDGGALGIQTDNTLWAWGNNAQGHLAQLNLVHRSSPVQIPGTTWCDVSSTDRAIAALKTDNTLWTWGANFAGQLSLNNRSNRSSPTQVPGTTWCAIDMAADRMVARKQDATLWMAGTNTYIDGGGLDRRSSPVQIPGNNWIDISLGNCVTGILKY